jgi:hypothetical protein
MSLEDLVKRKGSESLYAEVDCSFLHKVKKVASQRRRGEDTLTLRSQSVVPTTAMEISSSAELDPRLWKRQRVMPSVAPIAPEPKKMPRPAKRSPSTEAEPPNAQGAATLAAAMAAKAAVTTAATEVATAVEAQRRSSLTQMLRPSPEAEATDAVTFEGFAKESVFRSLNGARFARHEVVNEKPAFCWEFEDVEYLLFFTNNADNHGGTWRIGHAADLRQGYQDAIVYAQVDEDCHHPTQVRGWDVLESQSQTFFRDPEVRCVDAPRARAEKWSHADRDELILVRRARSSSSSSSSSSSVGPRVRTASAPADFLDSLLPILI